jgi:undecaprenyl-phosphate galactose phosphotransferase
MAKVESFSRALGVQDIILAVPSLGPEKLHRLTDRGEMLTETIRIAPGFGSIFTFGVEVDNWGSVMTLAVPRNLVKPWNILIKRSLEYVLALVLFILLAPVFLAVSLAIKLDSPGPVIYRQKRLARNNRVFSMLKFRSMVINNRPLLRDLLEQNREAKRDWSRFKKIRRHDPRVTRVGRFLRKHSLDELPQLINVLRGEMSLIGPRPYLPQEKKKIGRSLPIISLVKPGLTGLWQVNGRNRLAFSDRLAWDEYYIRNWSLWLDMSILLRTIKTMAKSEGAY